MINHKPLFLLLFVLVLPFLGFAQQTMIYSKIQITLDGTISVKTLNEAGLDIDHVHKNGKNTIDFVLSEKERRILDQLQIPHEVLIEDLTANFLELLARDRNTMVNMNCGLNNFDEGEMGMYHSYDDMVRHIQKMQEDFPDIVKVAEAGKTVEDRTVYSVKISDNVATNESATEGVVYYDALHHAREPMSLETHLYYMWWLLENYGTNDEATYLIDHREIYFIPVVNPDGYVYNQTNNPNGGGFWRKNRRVINASCTGVDLNRNYDVNWGNTAGSSSDPCSQTYHGTSAFSEPESQNVRDFIAQINPSIAFSCHTYSDVFLTPLDESFEYTDYDFIADYSSEFIPQRYKGYGSGVDMIGYLSTGSSRDYLTSQNTLAWVPEIGHQFWEAPSDICDRVQEVFPAMKYLSWVSGDYVTFHSAYLNNTTQLWHGDELELVVRVRNKGLDFTTQEVVVSASSPTGSVTPILTQANLGALPAREFKDNAATPFRFSMDGDYTVGEEIPIEIIVRQDGVITSQKTLIFYAGEREVLFSEDCENGPFQWENNSMTWDSTTMDFHGGSHGMADSPEQNYSTNANAILESLKPIDLSLAENPFLEFKAKWSMEEEFDYVQLEISTNQFTWTPLAGKHTEFNLQAEPAYTYNSYWVEERIDLKNYIGEEEVYIRFILTSDNGRNGDGFYFDDLEIVDYSAGISVSTNENKFGNSIEVFPNPHFGSTQLVVNSTIEEDMYLTVIDLSGKEIQQQKRSVNVGENTLNLDFAQPGVYFVKVQIGANLNTIRVVGF